jgi:hypothetical protein
VHLEAHLGYPAGPDAVAALLADRSFVTEVCAASSADAWDVEVSGTAQGAFTVTTERTLPTTGVPDAFRRFVGDSLRVRQVDTWEAAAADGTRSGTIRLEVVGAPVSARATTSLRAGGSGTEQQVSGELKAAVPLLGGRVERAAEPALVRALRDQERLAARHLAG